MTGGTDMKCSGCGRELEDGLRFCQYCGQDLSPEAAGAVAPSGVNILLEKRVTIWGFALLISGLILSMILSPLLVSSEMDQNVMVVDPNSYHAIRLEIYGLGMLRYSERQVSGTGSGAYILELDEKNFHRFVAGEEYDDVGYFPVGYGSGGEASMTGPIWVKYLVLVNDGPAPVSIEFEYHSFALVSLMVAGPVFGIALLAFLIVFVASKRRLSKM